MGNLLKLPRYFKVTVRTLPYFIRKIICFEDQVDNNNMHLLQFVFPISINLSRSVRSAINQCSLSAFQQPSSCPGGRLIHQPSSNIQEHIRTNLQWQLLTQRLDTATVELRALQIYCYYRTFPLGNVLITQIDDKTSWGRTFLHQKTNRPRPCQIYTRPLNGLPIVLLLNYRISRKQ